MGAGRTAALSMLDTFGLGEPAPEPDAETSA